MRQLFVCYFEKFLKANNTGYNFYIWLFLRCESDRANNSRGYTEIVLVKTQIEVLNKLWGVVWILNAEATVVVIPFIDLLWTSPERLRLGVLPSFGHYQQSDIYSLAIVMHELFERNGPFGVETIQIQPYGEYLNKSENLMAKTLFRLF